jgi:hypothetical protein
MTTAKRVLRDSLIREFGCLDDPNLPNSSEYTEHSGVGVADGIIVGAVIGNEAGGVVSSFHDTNDLNSRNKKFQKAVINMRMTLIDGEICICIHICICVYTYICMYVYTFMHVCI